MNFKQMLRLALAGLIVAQLPALAVEASFANQSKPLSQSGTLLAQTKPAPVVAPAKPAATTTVKPKPATSKKPAKKSKKTKLNKIVRRGVTYKFVCAGGNTTALVSTRPKKKASSPIPLIRWTEAGSKEFGGNYTPEARCSEVTARFNQHFIKRGKVRTSLPTLRIGTLNRLKVVCASRGACTSDKLLWTLKSANARNPAIIAQLKQLIKKPRAGNAPIFESEDEDMAFESEDPNAVEMEEVLGSVITTQLESEDPELAAELESEDAELESEDPAVESEDEAVETEDAELESEDAELESEDAELESEDAALESEDAALESEDSDVSEEVAN